MGRVTVAEVKAILDDTALSDAVITTFITSANVMVTQALGSSTLGVSVLKEIERWMTAHMIASSRERMAKSEEAGGAKISYTGQFYTGLRGTPYGQMVLVLDTTGAMAALGGKAVKLQAIKEFDD